MKERGIKKRDIKIIELKGINVHLGGLFSYFAFALPKGNVMFIFFWSLSPRVHVLIKVGNKVA